MLRLSVVLFTTLCLLLRPVQAQQQVRLCFSGGPFCTVATIANPMPVGAGTAGNNVGGAPQIRLCYAIPNSPFCQVVDAAHPLPVQ